MFDLHRENKLHYASVIIKSIADKHTIEEYKLSDHDMIIIREGDSRNSVVRADIGL